MLNIQLLSGTINGVRSGEEKDIVGNGLDLNNIA